VVAESNSSVPKHVVTKFDLVSFMVKRHKWGDKGRIESSA
jgi:hypothetical protein